MIKRIGSDDNLAQQMIRPAHLDQPASKTTTDAQSATQSLLSSSQSATKPLESTPQSYTPSQPPPANAQAIAAGNSSLLVLSDSSSASVDSSPMFSGVDGNRLKEHITREIFDKIPPGEIAGDKFLARIERALSDKKVGPDKKAEDSDNKENIPVKKEEDPKPELGFKNNEELAEFRIRLRAIIDPDKIQSKEAWKVEIFHKMDVAILSLDFTALNTEVYIMNENGLEAKVMLRQDWEAERAITLGLKKGPTEKDKASSETTSANAKEQTKELFRKDGSSNKTKKSDDLNDTPLRKQHKEKQMEIEHEAKEHKKRNDFEERIRKNTYFR